MGLGGSIFLIALGALLAFAVDYQLYWLDLTAAGWVLMLVGGLGLVLTLYYWNKRRNSATVVTERRHKDTGPPPPQM
ncbi:MAG TPA: DUF6458 family protein [Natronosporangium sp.]|jgi:uncharacterized membrane protein|nr:DUF6458 family protein [Natronosporangium sp.]